MPALLAMLLFAGSAAQAERLPMAAKGSAKPRLTLRFNTKKLQPVGKASRRYVPPLTQISVAHIEINARRHLAKAEALVRQAHGADSKVKRPELLDQAKQEFGRWEAQVRRLVRGRALNSPVYQEWTHKTWEAQLVQLHAAAKVAHPDVDVARALNGSAPAARVRAMLGRLHQLPRQAFEQAVSSAWSGLYDGARPEQERSLLKHNPLAMLTRPLALRGSEPGAKLVTYRTPRSLMSPKTWRRKTYQVRNDLAFVWVPGVHRTYTEFEKQTQTLMENGVLGVVANTGSWKNPFRNAYDVAAAVNKVRAVTKNPDVKIVLVGYSQGNTGAYAFLQSKGRNAREKASFAELRKNVVMVHDLNSAARGTPMADLGVVLTKILTGRSQEVKDIDTSLKNAAIFLDMKKNRVRSKVANWIGRNRKRVDRAIKAITGRNSKSWTSRVRAKVADGAHELLVGSLEGLTTYRGREVMENPTLQKVVAKMPILNSVGVVPEARGDMVPVNQPLDQRPGWRLMLKLGLANDYQVPEKLQRLKPAIPHAVDLPTQAIGHWGITGVLINKIHGEANYRDFSPELHSYAMLQQVLRMGL